mmetsp:Transcript_15442/g.23309  ORF Transcript_15442/g.23309 Transcript_15442/m.23309 type:complete len:320 (+) Transcript_15442:58-1017(+)
MTSDDTSCSKMDVVRCICACVVSSIERSEEAHYIPPREYDILSRGCTAEAIHPHSFSIEAVEYMFTLIHRQSDMESECLIVALIYIERLSKVTNNSFRICALNWRYTLITCMMLASKIWDDFSMLNADFAGIVANTSLCRLNQMECKVLEILDFSVMITREEYTTMYNTIQEIMYISLHEDLDLQLLVKSFQGSIVEESRSHWGRIYNLGCENGDVFRLDDNAAASTPNQITGNTPPSPRSIAVIQGSTQTACTLPLKKMQCSKCKYECKCLLRRRLGRAISFVSRLVRPRNYGKIHVGLDIERTASTSSPTITKCQTF